MSNEVLSVQGQLVGIPAVEYEGVSGVVVDSVNKKVSLDETVLFEGSAGSGQVINLSESPMNFERIKVFYSSQPNSVSAATKDVGIGYTEFLPESTNTVVLETVFVYDPTTLTDANTINHGVACYYNTQTTTWNRFISAWSYQWFLGGGAILTDMNFVYVHKIIGVNRKS